MDNIGILERVVNVQSMSRMSLLFLYLKLRRGDES